MSLTIPKAGVIAGRAPEIRVATPDTGSQLSSLGETMLDMGRKYQAEQLDYQGKKLQIDIARDMAAARREIEQLGDPAAVGPAWDAATAEIRSRYLDGKDDAGNPLTPPQLYKGIDITIGELGNRHTDALARYQTGLVNSQRAASWIELSDQIASEASTADPETVGALLEVATSAIDNQVATGAMSPEEAAKQKLILREEIYTARATNLIDADPQAFLTAADAGDFAGLGATGLATAKAKAQGALDRAAAAEATAAKVAANARETAIGKRLREMSDMMFQGFAVTDADYLKDPEVMTNPDWPEAMAAQSLLAEIPNIRQMNIAQLDAQIASEEAAPKSRKFQIERVNLLRKWREAAAAKWNTDGVEQAKRAGMTVAELPDFDPANPQYFANALPGRLALDRFAVANEYTDTQALVSKAEKAKLDLVLDPKADAGPKLELAKAILDGSGGDLPRVLTVLGGDPVFGTATRLVRSTGDEALAASMLRGQQKIELNTVTVPAPRLLQRAFDGATGGAFDSNPIMKARILAAATALYADSAAGIDPESQSGTGWLDDSTAIDLFTTSVQRVSGAQPDRNGRLTVGGVQDINGGYVSLPVGVPAAAVETALDSIGRHLRGQRRSADGWDSSATDTPPDPLRALAAASIDGRRPDLGADPARRLAEMQLQRVLTKAGEETDQYRFVRFVNGTAYPLGDADGIEYRFRLPALIREAAK